MGVNSVEIAAYGTATYAAKLYGKELNKDELMDFVSFSYGVGLDGGSIRETIPIWTRAPIQRTTMFTTCHDGQNSVRIDLFAGIGDLIKYSLQVGQLLLTGLPPLPAGSLEVDVTFKLNWNFGVLQVSASAGIGINNTVSLVLGEAMPFQMIDELEQQPLIQGESKSIQPWDPDKGGWQPQEWLVKDSGNIFTGRVPPCLPESVD